MKKRSKLRLILGKIYFTLRKKWYWHFSGMNFANQLKEETLPYLIFTHKTPLLRQLSKVEMYLQHNKVANLKIAIKKIDGLILKPNEVFSYWRLIGNPTKRKGYLPGMVLWNGQVKTGIGGGLCQLSNLIYWMTLHSPLKVIERWRHSYDVFPDHKRSQPFGSGATCAYPNIDLQIKNETSQIFQLRLKIDGEYLRGEWRSNEPTRFKYEIFEQNHRIEDFFGNYTRYNEIYRNVFDKSTEEIIHIEFITKNRAIMMYTPLLESPH